jgi:hypothetical protein
LWLARPARIERQHDKAREPPLLPMTRIHREAPWRPKPAVWVRRQVPAGTSLRPPPCDDAGPIDEQAPLGALPQAWQTEAPDPDWTENMLGYVSSLLASAELSESMVDRVECRETACRLVLGQMDLEPMTRLSSLANNDGLRWMQRQEDDRGTQHLVLYVPRD